MIADWWHAYVRVRYHVCSPFDCVFPERQAVDTRVLEPLEEVCEVSRHALSVRKPVLQTVLVQLGQVAAVESFFEVALLLLSDVAIHVSVQAAEGNI